MLIKKSRIFLVIILVTSVFSVTLFSNSLKFASNIEDSPDKTIELFDLKSSGPQINITTPENKTYYGPMSGYYPATYGFENDIVGSFPNEWDEIVGSGCAVDIKDLEGEHENVVRIYDNDLTYNAVLNNQFQNQTTGTIEWWVKKSSGDTGCYFNFYGGNDWDIANRAIDFGIDAGNNGAFAVRDDGPWVFDYSYSDGTWYHLKVEFDCTNYNFTVYKNGVPLFVNVSFWRKMDTINLMSIGTNTFRAGTFYTDAIGYSWDPNYNVGDNINEGLLLSYENSTVLDWVGYSLDGQANSTVLGNTTIPFPTIDGVHTIQVFGNNSIGTNFQSDIRYFSVKHIKMITPENKTYTEPISGYYPAIYGFENDKEGSNPNGWNTTEPISCSVDVVGEVGGHKRVVYLTDGNAAGYPQINKTISLTSGIVEFWIRAGETNRQHYISIKDDANNGVHLYMTQFGLWRYVTTGPVYNNIEVYNANQWYHVKIEFDTSNFHLWIDGVSKDNGSGYGLAGSPSSFKKIQFNTDYGETGGDMWIDAIGYSWAPSYTIGDNLDEGLLVSFDLGFSPDWLGYSLDSQTNKTIIGNYTIPFPSEGPHTIQVLGNDAWGALYQSELRYFSIDTLAPTSMISFTPYRDPNFVIKSTIFTITADDGLGSGVSLIRYKINNLNWNTYTGPFNLSTYEYDVYNITYQAIDVVGYIESENTITVILISEPSQPGIPGYQFFVVIGVISIVSAILIKKRSKL